MILTARQSIANSLLAKLQRHTLLVGGSRSGKTALLVRAILMRAVRAAASRHAILRFRGNAVRQSIWLDTLPKVANLCFPDLKIEYRERDLCARLPNRSEIWLGGLDDKERVEKILGQEYSSVYFNECSQIPWSSITTASTRLAQKIEGLRNRAYYDLNPTGTGHWSYKLFIQKRSPDSLSAVPDPENYEHCYMNPGDNAQNIDADYLRSLQNLPERQRRRFFEGIYTADLDGALWSIEMIEGARISEIPPNLIRIVVAVDPSGAAGPEDFSADEIGIAVCALMPNGHGCLLEDLTGRYSPEQWSAVVCAAFQRWRADRVIAEKNFGGDMVRAVIQSRNRLIPVRLVPASRGKVVRAEPIAALYERGLIHHVGQFPELEDELMNFTTKGYMGSRSPNRGDALVWGFTELAEPEQTVTVQSALPQGYRSQISPI